MPFKFTDIGCSAAEHRGDGGSSCSWKRLCSRKMLTNISCILHWLCCRWFIKLRMSLWQSWHARWTVWLLEYMNNVILRGRTTNRRKGEGKRWIHCLAISWLLRKLTTLNSSHIQLVTPPPIWWIPTQPFPRVLLSPWIPYVNTILSQTMWSQLCLQKGACASFLQPPFQSEQADKSFPNHRSEIQTRNQIHCLVIICHFEHSEKEASTPRSLKM